MLGSPYRSPARAEPLLDDARGRSDRQLLSLLALTWVVSAIRVAGALYFAETMGAESTIALLVVLFVPVAVSRPLLGKLSAYRRAERH